MKIKSVRVEVFPSRDDDPYMIEVRLVVTTAAKRYAENMVLPYSHLVSRFDMVMEIAVSSFKEKLLELEQETRHGDD